MREVCRVGTLAFAILAWSVSVSTAAEADVLSALGRVRQGIEEGGPHEEVAQRLEEARVQVDAIRIGDTTDCFRAAVKRCYYWYRLGTKSWETLIKNQEERAFHAKQAKSEYCAGHLKTICLNMVENYDKLISHAQEALPSKWEYGHAALDEARECQKSAHN